MGDWAADHGPDHGHPHPTRQLLVVTGNQVQLQRCSLYATHWVPVIEAHHICPESWWAHLGIPDASPLADICPNCHMSTHVAIDARIKGQDASLLPPRCLRLAAQAFTIAAANGLTPALTL